MVDLLELDVDLVFYDATTAWFETDEADVASHQWRGLAFDPLRQRGPSKEGRDNHPQEADDPSLQERASGDARGDPQGGDRARRHPGRRGLPGKVS